MTSPADPDIDPYAYIEGRADELDELFGGGLGNVLRSAWNTFAPSAFHHCGLALAATSGAETELDYYTDGGRQ